MAKATTEPKPKPDLTSAELRDAERELQDGSIPLESSTPDRLAALLGIWIEFETSRLRSEEQYRLTLELPGAGRDGLVQQYARARKGLGLVEARIAEVLKEGEDADLISRPFRASGGLVQFPEPLAKRLLALLQDGEDTEKAAKAAG